MNPCENCSALLLDHLYGLLEAEEAAQVRAHLEGCPACRAALAGAEAEQGLLARAAQVYRAVPTFSAPGADAPLPEVVGQPQQSPVPVDAPTPAPSAVPAPTLPMTPRPARPRGRALRWAVPAAAAALAITASGLYLSYVAGHGERKDEETASKDEVQKLDRRLATLTADYQRELDGLPERTRARHLPTMVVGPGALQRGGDSVYHVQTRDLDGRPALAEVSVRVTEGDKGKVIYEKKGIASEGDVAVKVPGDVAVEQGKTARIELEAATALARETVTEALQVREPACVTHLTLDRAAYRAGDTVLFRSLTLDRFSLKAPGQVFDVAFTLRDAVGRAVRTVRARTRPDGIAGGELPLTADLPEGDYVLQVAAADVPGRHFPPQARPLSVRRDQSPALELERRELLAGEMLRARLSAAPGEEGVARLRLPGRAGPGGIDGKEPLADVKLKTDKAGKAEIRMPVPGDVDADRGTLEVELGRAGGARRQLSQPFTVIAPRRSVEFFPEGGDLVAGLPGRVYFRVQTLPGESAHLEGRVLDGKGRAVAEVATAAGAVQPADDLRLGIFELAPKAGEAYRLVVTAPAALRGEFALPPVAASGVSLRVAATVGKEGGPVRAMVRATSERPLLVLATCRGHTVEQQFVTGGPEGTEVRLDPVAGTRGVVRLTVYEPRAGDLHPVAERPVFQAAGRELALSFALNKQEAGKALAPGGRAGIEVKALTEKGDPADGVGLAAVLDEVALRGTAKGLEAGTPAHFLLASALPQADGLDDADFLLRDTPAAREALDLFLGTAGWRRFVRLDRAAEVLVRAAGQPGQSEAGAAGRFPAPDVFSRDTLQAVKARFTQDYAAREALLREEFDRQKNHLLGERERKLAVYARALTEVNAYEQLPEQLLRLGLGVLALVLVATGAVALVVGLVKLLLGSASTTPAFATAFGALAGCLVLFLGTGDLRNGDDPAAARPVFSAQLRVPPEAELQAPPKRPVTAGHSAPTGTFHRPVEVQSAGSGGQGVREETEKAQAEDLRRALDQADQLAQARVGRKVAAENAGGLAGSRDRFDRRGDAAAKDGKQFAPGGAVPVIRPQFDPSSRPAAPSSEGKGAAPGPAPAPGLQHASPTTVPPQAKSAGGPSPTAMKNDAPKIAEGAKKGGAGRGGEAKEKDAVANGGEAKVADAADLNMLGVLREHVYARETRSNQEKRPQPTLLWLPALELKDGRAQMWFDLPDVITTYRVLLYGHDAAGRLGFTQGTFEVRPRP